MFNAKEFIKLHKRLDKQFRKSYKFKANENGCLIYANDEQHIVYRDNCGDIFECMNNAKAFENEDALESYIKERFYSPTYKLDFEDLRLDFLGYDERIDDIVYTLVARNIKSNQYNAIGFITTIKTKEQMIKRLNEWKTK